MGRHALAHTRGTAAEYAAASWFLLHGQQVYWPAMQQDAVDFIVDKEGRLVRVQVKMADSVSGRHYGRLHRSVEARRRFLRADLIVFVSRNLSTAWVIPRYQLPTKTSIPLADWESYKVLLKEKV